MTEFNEFSFFLGSVYEPLKSINLPRPNNETLWEKLDHYYRIGKQTGGRPGACEWCLLCLSSVTCSVGTMLSRLDVVLVSVLRQPCILTAY